MSVSILIPYRRQEDTYRSHNLQAVTSHWCRYIDKHLGHAYDLNGGGYEIVIGTNDEEPFNRSAARNNAFNKSDGSVLVLCDADTLFVDHDSMVEAVYYVRMHPDSWVIPYGTYWNASQSWTDRYYKERTLAIGAPGTFEHRLRRTICGMIVMHRNMYEDIGGYDERFRGWGYEDDAFGYVLDALYGKPNRFDEFDVIHLWHPHPPETNFGQPNIDHNRALLEEYRVAAATETMRSLIEAR